MEFSPYRSVTLCSSARYAWTIFSLACISLAIWSSLAITPSMLWSHLSSPAVWALNSDSARAISLLASDRPVRRSCMSRPIPMLM